MPYNAVDIILHALSVSALIGQVFIVFSLVYAVFKKKLEFIAKPVKKYALEIAFIIALSSTLGSLFFSEIKKFVPCSLCWYQRIVMYPQAVILGIAILKKDRGIKKYILPMSVIGAALSVYHYYIQMFESPYFCSGTVISCAAEYFTGFGYINIPLMALTGFLMIILLFTVYWEE